ncbi:baseplate megatron protein TIM-barrel domain-containing protein [Pseudosulfitobacter koreensis]|uniref:Glycoside hydrolase TIM-barrel-like domain-containing protein n=1 Tax=Pseudosulfitobacter koreensis TaxID=2968472 RepID=A0ABT1YXV7_9RHOB|nr:glycoside hydrolase TIM-barrel-like domain-containing protein [Pseudosulfitobacter koreense]MCR8825666.1 glycoside hydrolase TIM-barrel-like domain-containing protein [Pseudosulfitobacter koreense]
MPHQLPPKGDWRAWVILGGRGAGKTRAGAEWVRSKVEGARPFDAGACTRVALVGETQDQVREVMIFGDSGIMACSPPDRRPKWVGTRKRLEWPNGAVATVHSAHDPEGLRGPQFDAAWVDELGCAAVDKGTNQPNTFLDAKSSESDLPHYSNGARDDLIQKQYLRAIYSYWGQAERNPVSIEYNAPMLDLSRSFVWAWDMRPYPFFPNNTVQWSDGDNYTRGHWINGRTGARTLASVVGEICTAAGLLAYDTSALHGYVRGYVVGEVADARASLQPLMLRYGFDAVERDGVLTFRTRDGLVTADVPAPEFAMSEEMEGTLEQIREAEAEMVGRVRLRFVQADGNFETIAEEAVLPDEATQAVATSDIALAMTRAEGRQVAERWLIEARVARDTVRVALPPSWMAVGAGDVIALADAEGSTGQYRVDRVEQGAMQMLEAVRIEPGVYTPSDMQDLLATVRGFVPPVPVSPFFLDLPMMTGDEVPHAPHLAITARPWPGSVAVYSAPTEEDFALNTVVAQEAVIGLAQSTLVCHAPGIWDEGAALEVRLLHGTLSAVTETAVLNGRNLCAIGDGSSDNWELFQFRDAELIGPDTYLLRHRLRGQLGTDALMPDAWPVGSWVVLMNGTPTQIEMAASMRRVAQHYRIGPARRSLDDPSFVAQVQAFDGNGLRPYAPVHLRAEALGTGDVVLTWIRRTRIDGDGWDTPEVPLGEDVESYRVRVLREGAVLREQTVGAPAWTYGAAEQAADAALGGLTLEVAQISARYGAGLAGRIAVTL